MRGQDELGCHLAALYPHAQLSRFYPWFYLYVTHVRSVPRRSAFSYWKRKKAGTAGYEAIGKKSVGVHFLPYYKGKKSVGVHSFFPYYKGKKSVGVHCFFPYYRGKRV